MVGFVEDLQVEPAAGVFRELDDLVAEYAQVGRALGVDQELRWERAAVALVERGEAACAHREDEERGEQRDGGDLVRSPQRDAVGGPEHSAHRGEGEEPCDRGGCGCGPDPLEEDGRRQRKPGG